MWRFCSLLDFFGAKVTVLFSLIYLVYFKCKADIDRNITYQNVSGRCRNISSKNWVKHYLDHCSTEGGWVMIQNTKIVQSYCIWFTFLTAGDSLFLSSQKQLTLTSNKQNRLSHTELQAYSTVLCVHVLVSCKLRAVLCIVVPLQLFQIPVACVSAF